MNMQIAITGRGGQGVLFLTRILSECALDMGLEVIASETHGMAMRGGSVISTLKVGPFRGPLIGSGQADLMLVLDPGSYETFSHLLSIKGVTLSERPELRILILLLTQRAWLQKRDPRSWPTWYFWDLL